MTNSDRWQLICETEDALCEADIFYNGFTNRRKANPDSYGTCVDFAKLDAWLNAQTLDAQSAEQAGESFLRTNRGKGYSIRAINRAMNQTPEHASSVRATETGSLIDADGNEIQPGAGNKQA